MQQLDVALKVKNLFLEVVGIGIEFLSAGHGNGILQLCAAHLDDVLELLCLVAQCADEPCERSNEALVHTDESETDGGGIDIVGGLSAVAVVVRQAILVVALLVAHDLEGAVGNHLVGIHVDTGAGTPLHHVDGEVLMPFAVDDFTACLRNGPSDFVVDDAQCVVGLHGSQLDVCDGDDVVGIVAHLFARNVIVVNATLSLHAIKCISRNLEFT